MRTQHIRTHSIKTHPNNAHIVKMLQFVVHFDTTRIWGGHILCVFTFEPHRHCSARLPNQFCAGVRRVALVINLHTHNPPRCGLMFSVTTTSTLNLRNSTQLAPGVASGRALVILANVYIFLPSAGLCWPINLSANGWARCE